MAATTKTTAVEAQIAFKNMIRDNFVYLVDNIPVKDMLPYLYQAHVLSIGMMQEVENCSYPSSRLLWILPTRGPKACMEFLNVLRMLKRSDIVEQLMDKGILDCVEADCIDGKYIYICF